ncbi:MAG: tetratricopeptide repeat protein [Bacteroidetes bacterium]|nr:MAG: tetratricopeptide repeat protein [Bacteroidota bacterium]
MVCEDTNHGKEKGAKAHATRLQKKILNSLLINNYDMQQHLQKALDALQRAQYAQVFKILHEAEVMNIDLNILQKEFVKGKTDTDFEERLEVAIKKAFDESGNLTNIRFLSHLPSPTSHFIGREAELKMLHENLQAGKRTVLVNGVGGVGKTTLVQKYAHDYQTEYAHILYIRQSGNLWDLFVQTDLLDTLCLAYNAQTDRQVLFANVLKKLKALPATNLLLIDNYEPTESDQTQDTLGQLFALPTHWRVVCTSRVDVPIFDKTMRLHVLPPDEAIEVFRQHAGNKPQDTAEIRALLEMIGYHTLMTELLAKTYRYCPQFGTVGKMHVFLQEKGLQNPYLAKEIYMETQPTYLYAYLRKVFSLASLTEGEVWLLKQWAVLPTTPHQAMDFLTWIQDTDLAYENTLLALAKKGWLQTDDNLAYLLHPFLQLFLHEELKPTLPDCEKMCKYFVDLIGSEEVEANPLAHQWTSAIGEGMLQNIDFTAQAEKQGILLNRLDSLYSFLGDYPNAIRCAKEGVAIIEVTVGKQHPNYATALNNVASLYWNTENYAEALPLYEEALQIDEKISGKQSQSYATSLNNLATLYYNQGDYAKALSLFEEASQIQKEVLGERHPAYASSLNNLALLYDNQGDYAKALPLYEKSLQIRKEVLGERHPDTAISLHNIGTLYFRQGNYTQARQYFEEAYSICLEKLGEQHPYTQDTKRWLDKLPRIAK